MPISEDELDHKGSSQGHQGYHSHQNMQIHSHQSVTGMSKAEQRRSNKPIMEKRRRARINHCLNELKSLILDAMKKDPARHSKLEKADILEMTVKHLQNVQRQQLAVAVATDPNVLHKFRTGFNECAGEVSRYIGRIEGVDPAVRTRLLAHLASCVSGLHQLTPFSFGAMAAVSSTPPGSQVPFPPPPTPPNAQTLSASSSATVPLPTEEGGVLPCGTPCSSASIPTSIHIPQFHSGDVNNNQSQQQSPAARLMAGLQLIPSRLPTGELALLLPGSGRLSDGMDGGMSFSSSVSPGISASLSTSSSSILNTSGPSPSASGSPHGHHSAFTAVTRNSSSPPSPPPPLQMAVGPSSPASSTSSSCASTSCDSTTFAKHPTSVEQHQHIQQPHLSTTEDHKFSFGFHCPPLQQSPFSSDVKTFPFPPLSLSNPVINSAPITSSFIDASESVPIMPPLKADARESKHEVMQPKALNLEKDVTSTQDDPCTHFKHRELVSGTISASQSLSPCAECPIAPVLSASSKLVLNEGKLSCPPIPSIVAPLAPYFSSAVVSSSTRDPLDFSVKKERAFGEDLTNDRIPRLSLGYGIKRLAEDNECSNAEDDEMPRPTKIARLDVKLEPSLGSRDGLKDSVVTEGKVTIDFMARASSSSTISSSASTSAEEGSSLDMWRPW